MVLQKRLETQVNPSTRFPDRLSGLSHGVPQQPTTPTFIAQQAPPVGLAVALPGQVAGPVDASREKLALVAELAVPAVAAPVWEHASNKFSPALASLPHINTTNGDSDMTDAAFENRNVCWLHDLTTPPPVRTSDIRPTVS